LDLALPHKTTVVSRRGADIVHLDTSATGLVDARWFSNGGVVERSARDLYTPLNLGRVYPRASRGGI
jgi:hypothetical protein